MGCLEWKKVTDDFSGKSNVRRWMRRPATVETPFGPLAGGVSTGRPKWKKVMDDFFRKKQCPPLDAAAGDCGNLWRFHRSPQVEKSHG